MLKWILPVLMLGSGLVFAKDQETLSCEVGDGRHVCYAMDTAISGYRWGCRGEKCRQLWRNQYRNAENAAYEILNAPARHVASNVGEKANLLARNICGTTRTFRSTDYDVIIPLIDQENALLGLLRDLQEQAGLRDRDIRYCQLTINR